LLTFAPAMQIQVLKSKIHRIKVTEAKLDYIGSVTIDEDLMDAVNLIENEQVHVLNYTNGERIITYVIKGERGSGIICLNGPAALKFSPGDHAIILSYATMDFEEARKFRPAIIFPDVNTNKIKK
jgi:aspartate 1-decarboxylase